MATIYLSSPFVDLEAHRKAVAAQLTSMHHQVNAMEHYVASDDRPADKCLRDVEQSSLYIGLFAWRYGSIPSHDNPNNWSVTEMEYRHAEVKSIPRLVFLLDENAAWPPKMIDSHTGAGDSGRRIRELRRQLGEELLTSSFTSPEDLAAKVAAAVHLAGTITNTSDASLTFDEIVGADNIDPVELLGSSYLPILLQQLQQRAYSPLLKIDLRDGEYWWSTRLYALAQVADLTDLEWFLFVDNGSRYVGMVRPRDLARALATAQPPLETEYRLAYTMPPDPWMSTQQYAASVLERFVTTLNTPYGREEGLRFLVSSSWLKERIPALSTFHLERSGPFNPLATHQLLQAKLPYVAITDEHGQLMKVIDRVGVATEIARTVVERQLEPQ